MEEKNKIFMVGTRKGQFELITEDKKICLWMYDTLQYEYFLRSQVKGEINNGKGGR